MINITILNIYTICNKILFKLNKIKIDPKLISIEQEYDFKILKSKVKVMSVWCYSMLDNSIKQHLIKRNVTVYSDVVVGFDTEFVAYDYNINKLLSAQVSFSHVIKLIIPLFKNFEFEGVNTLTSEIYLKAIPLFDDPSLIKHFIMIKILENRKYKFGKHDEIMSKIANYFYQNPNVNNIVSYHNSLNICLEKTPIKNLFIIAKPNEDLKLSLTTLMRLIEMNCPERVDSENLILNELRDLEYWNLTNSLPDFIGRFAESWNAKTMQNTPIERIVLSNEENSKLTLEKVEDSSNYTYDILVFENSHAKLLAEAEAEEEEYLGKNLIRINIRRKIYLTAHYNSADFTLLED